MIHGITISNRRFQIEPHKYGGQEDFDKYGQQKKFELVESTPQQQQGQEVGGHLDREEAESSNLYHRLKEVPKKHFKNITVRTPFMTYTRRK